MMTSPGELRDEAEARTVEVPPEDRTKLVGVVSAYLAIQVALAADDLSAARQAAESLIAAVLGVELRRPPGAATAWSDVARGLGQHGRHVKLAQDLEAARAGFEGLSREAQVLLRRFGNPLETPLSVAFCPMASGSTGAAWVQRGTTIENSYFGQSMRSCGEVRREVLPGEFLESPSKPTGAKQSSTASGEHRH